MKVDVCEIDRGYMVSITDEFGPRGFVEIIRDTDGNWDDGDNTYGGGEIALLSAVANATLFLANEL